MVEEGIPFYRQGKQVVVLTFNDALLMNERENSKHNYRFYNNNYRFYNNNKFAS